MAKTRLRLATRRWMNRIIATYVLDENHLRILELCGMAWDRALEAKETVDRQGPYFLDRFGQTRSHPGIDIEMRAMTVFVKTLREIGFDLEDAPESRLPRQYK